MDQIKVQQALSEIAAPATATATAPTNTPATATAPAIIPVVPANVSALQQQALPSNNNVTEAAPPAAQIKDAAPVASMPTMPAIVQTLASVATPQQEAPRAPDIHDRGSQHHPVAEFLYQLTKMLTDDNSEIIEWVDGRIKVHHPERLESEVLHKYFRHSKFASFQRQLNYFGFRKIAGKGKMSPCSYVNENATSDIRSLLLIKRKTNGSAARKAAMQQRAALQLQGSLNPALGTGLPGLVGAPGMQGLVGAPGMQGMAPAGFGLNPLQMQQNPLSHLLVQQTQQQRHSWNDLQQLGSLKPNMPSIEQLQAQLATLSKQQAQGGANAALNAAALSMATNAGAINFAQLQGNNAAAAAAVGNNAAENPATAALNAAASQQTQGGATAAMNAVNSAPGAGQQTNLFDSATNLKSLLGNDQTANGGNVQQLQVHQQGVVQGQNLLNRLPSNNMFSGNVSSASLGGLLASSNRLSSLLSLNSFLSRDPSLADLAMMPNGAHLAALQQNQQQMTNNFNSNQTS